MLVAFTVFFRERKGKRERRLTTYVSNGANTYRSLHSYHEWIDLYLQRATVLMASMGAKLISKIAACLSTRADQFSKIIRKV